MNNRFAEHSVSIRNYRHPQDYYQVRQLWESAGPGVHLGQSDAVEEIEKKVGRDPDLFLVAESSGQIIGAVLGGFDGRRGLIYHLAVAKAARQQGIGTELMSELEKRLRSLGCRKCYLLVLKDNTGAMKFYEAKGWERMDLYIYGKEMD